MQELPCLASEIFACPVGLRLQIQQRGRPWNRQKAVPKHFQKKVEMTVHELWGK
jgi:hypothetical protein